MLNFSKNIIDWNKVTKTDVINAFFYDFFGRNHISDEAAAVFDAIVNNIFKTDDIRVRYCDTCYDQPSSVELVCESKELPTFIINFGYDPKYDCITSYYYIDTEDEALNKWFRNAPEYEEYGSGLIFKWSLEDLVKAHLI